VLHSYSNRLFVLPGPEHSNGNAAEFYSVSDQMLRFLRGMFDAIVIDAGHFGYGFIEQNARKSDKVLLICELNLLSLANTNKILGILRRVLTDPEEKIQVIINRFAKKSDISLDEAEKILKTRVFWKVPNDYKFAVSAINNGKPYEQMGRRHRITRNMNQLAEAVMPETENGSHKWKWFFK
jgi:pilus assembly protein CpaE